MHQTCYILYFFFTVFKLFNMSPNLSVQLVCVCESTDFMALHTFKSKNPMHIVLWMTGVFSFFFVDVKHNVAKRKCS